MKKILLRGIWVLLSLILLASCSKDHDKPDTPKNAVAYEDLPQESRTFLEAELPDATVKKVEQFERVNAVGTFYSVTLNNGLRVDFNKDGDWTGIRGGSSIPENVIFPGILEYVKTHYPDQKIREIELEHRGYEVELSNDTELYFSLEGDFIFADQGDEDEEEVPIRFEELPQNARDFLTQNFPDAEYVVLTKEEDDGKTEYEIKMANRIEIDFDADGNWTSIDANRQQIPDGLIPEAILAYVQDHYQNAFITEIEKEGKTFEVELSDDTDLKFDAEGKFLGKGD